VGSTRVFIDKGVAKIGATGKIQIHGEERCVVDAVDVAQLVVEFQAVQKRRSFWDAEDVVGEQVAVYLCRDEAIDCVDRVFAEDAVSPALFEHGKERLDVLDPLKRPGFEVGDPLGPRDGRPRAGGHGEVGSGGKQVLLGISKRGDTYLRTLLIHGARAVIRVAERKAGHTDSWLARLMGRRNTTAAAVALANKNARTVWALLAHDREFRPDYIPTLAAA